MNGFRLIGDLLHLQGILLLIVFIVRNKSCTGISGRSQILLLMVFITRYLDLFSYSISLYNSLMKVFFISSTLLTVFLVYGKYRNTYDRNHDTLRFELIIVPVAALAMLNTYYFDVREVLWAFSTYLEAVAILPQLYMSNMKEVQYVPANYLFLQGFYKFFYILNWIYRDYYEGYWDSISFVSGFIQTITYTGFIYLYFTKGNLKTFDNVFFLSSTKHPVILKSIPDPEVTSQEKTVHTPDNVSKMEKPNVQMEIDSAIPLIQKEIDSPLPTVHSTIVANDEKQPLVDSLDDR